MSPTHPFSEILRKQKIQETRDSIQGRVEGNPQNDGERNSKGGSRVPHAEGKEKGCEQVRRLRRLFHEKIKLIEHLMCLDPLRDLPTGREFKVELVMSSSKSKIMGK